MRCSKTCKKRGVVWKRNCLQVMKWTSIRHLIFGYWACRNVQLFLVKFLIWKLWLFHTGWLWFILLVQFGCTIPMFTLHRVRFKIWFWLTSIVTFSDLAELASMAVSLYFVWCIICQDVHGFWIIFQYRLHFPRRKPEIKIKIKNRQPCLKLKRI